MKKIFITFLSVVGLFFVWRFILAMRQQKASLSEAGKIAMQTVQSAFVTNMRVPVLAQVGKQPLDSASLNPISNSMGTNPIYRASMLQLSPREVGSGSFSYHTSGNSSQSEIVPERFSPGWFDLMNAKLRN